MTVTYDLTFLRRGDVALLSSLNVADSSAPWSINSIWAKGHAGVVRSVFWDENVRFLGAAISNANLQRSMKFLSQEARIQR
jgi:hypothetical protein